MSPFNLTEHPHRRFNPLTRDWVLVSPHRTERPWQGQVDEAAIPAGLRYDPACYMCPGNLRASGARNPAYTATFVFDNDFPALLPTSPPGAWEEGQGLLAAEAERGVCRVICFSPRHDVSLARMDRAAVGAVVDVWTAQYQELGARPYVGHVQIFENRGTLMGASNPHPHCQVWANSTVPNEVAKEQRALEEYQARRGACLLCDYLTLERKLGERLVTENGHFTAVVPFWAVWPFEILIVSRGHRTALDRLDRGERDSLADLLKRVAVRYDRLFEAPFPYSMGFHQRPTDGAPHDEWHLHAHFYPPLLRSATVRKFMVGYEMLAAPQRDIAPEAAARRLRETSEAD